MVKVLLTLLLIQSQTYAFTLNTSFAAAFDKEEVIINMAQHDCDEISAFNNEEILSMAKEAMDKFWNRVPTSFLKIRMGSVINVSSDFETERLCSSNSGSCTPNPALAGATEILISCNKDTGTGSPNFPSNTVLAVTLPINTEGKAIKGAVILINNKSGTAADNLTREEFISVLAHEVGHAFGLGHSPVTDSLMYYTNLKDRKYLGQDDHDGVSYLYPREQPTSCGTVAYLDNDKMKGLFSFTLLGILMMVALKRNPYALSI